MDSPTAKALADMARAYVLRRHGDPGRPVKVVVQLDAGLELEAVSVELCPAAVAAAPAGGEVHENILEALLSADSPLTGPQLASAAGYAYGGRFRSALSALVREGRVVNLRPGYALPDTSHPSDTPRQG